MTDKGHSPLCIFSNNRVDSTVKRILSKFYISSIFVVATKQEERIPCFCSIFVYSSDPNLTILKKDFSCAALLQYHMKCVSMATKLTELDEAPNQNVLLTF